MRADILVVDDEPGPRESLRMILKKDHDVRTAASGDEALIEIERARPDLMFLDLRMPGMDGRQVMKIVKRDHPDVEIAVVTAYAAVDSARLALRIGAVDYLIKPYSVQDVQHIVERVLNSRREKHDAQVLAAQLLQLADGLSDHERTEAGGDVAMALDKIRSVRETLDEDLRTVKELLELGELTAEFSHDVSNLLTIILTSGEFLLEQLDGQSHPGSMDRWVNRIAAAAEDCSEMLHSVRDYAVSAASSVMQPVSLGDVASAAIETVSSRTVAGGARDLQFVVRLRAVPEIQGDPLALRNAVVNLLDNAADAMDRPGTIEVATDIDGDDLLLRVRDEGTGMPPEVLAQARQAFFTTKGGRGTGLGLSIAQKTARRHSGEIEIESQEGVGTTVTLRLPCKPRAVTPPPEPSPEAGSLGTVIVADDQSAMLEMMSRILRSHGYEVLAASDGMEAWELCVASRSENPGRKLVVVTDHEMPGLLGRELAAKVKDLDEGIPILVISGYPIETQGPEDVLVCKPFDLTSLLGTVQRLMEKARPAVP